MSMYLRMMPLILMVVAFLAGSTAPTAFAQTAVDVCIDPGHSLAEPGAINEAYGLKEVDINLEVSKRLAQLLDGTRSYYFTWHPDGSLPAANRDGNINGRERAKICNSVNARVVVSVHTNSIDSTTRDGVWMGYHGGESQQFAQNMADLTWQYLFTNSGPYANAAWAEGDTIFYGTEVFANSLLIHTDMPAVLFEPLFMSDSEPNGGEAAALQTTIFGDGSLCTDCRREQIAQTLFAGIQAQLGDGDGGGGGGISLSVTGYKVKGVQHADLTWSGATATHVDVHRNGVVITTTANDGAYTDNIGQKGGGSHTYKVCEAGTTTCSNEATVTF